MYVYKYVNMVCPPRSIWCQNYDSRKFMDATPVFVTQHLWVNLSNLNSQKSWRAINLVYIYIYIFVCDPISNASINVSTVYRLHRYTTIYLCMHRYTFMIIYSCTAQCSEAPGQQVLFAICTSNFHHSSRYINQIVCSETLSPTCLWSKQTVIMSWFSQMMDSRTGNTIL